MADTFVLLDTLPPQFFKVDGETIVPLSGGSLESFASGTTTPQNVYDADGNSLGSVLTLDSRGEIMTVKNIWLKVGDDYKFRLKDADGVEVWTVDNITTDQGIREFSDAITINVPSAKAPMVLNALAQGQLVTGLNADQVDGAHVGTNNGNVVLRENLSSAAQAATESAQGVAELATQTEVDDGNDDARIVTPAKLNTALNGNVLGLISGEADHGDTIPLPSGFSASETHTSLSFKSVPDYSESNSDDTLVYFELSMDASRVLTCQSRSRGSGFHTGTARYVVIGVKAAAT